MMSTITKRNLFWQCSYCLEIMVTKEECPGAQCGICNQAIRFLGYSGSDNKLLRDEDRCPCDGRCTSARGPHCDCVCNGANHGSGRLVTVTITAGAIPKLSPSNPDEAIKRGKEYAELRRAIKDKLIEVQYRLDNKIWVNRPAWIAHRNHRSTLAAIHAKTTHKTRLTALTKLLEELSA